MKRILPTAIQTICALLTFNSFGQSNWSVNVPAIWNTVTVKNNWTPLTAPNYKEYINGHTVGYGLNVDYSFHPKVSNFSVKIGTGYFNQRFNVTRPFSFKSPNQLLFYTNQYSYHCLQGLVSVSYNYMLNVKYIFTGSLDYNIFYSFQQEYTPTYPSYSTQANYNKINFGKIASLNVGLNKYLGSKFSLGLHALIPFYTAWRNDKIFNDDPKTYYHPKFSFGSYLSVSYRVK